MSVCMCLGMCGAKWQVCGERENSWNNLCQNVCEWLSEPPVPPPNDWWWYSQTERMLVSYQSWPLQHELLEFLSGKRATCFKTRNREKQQLSSYGIPRPPFQSHRHAKAVWGRPRKDALRKKQYYNDSLGFIWILGYVTTRLVASLKIQVC